MAIDLKLLSKKLIDHRNTFGLSIEDLSNKSGISADRLENFESCFLEPTGDEILILADVYLCDYKFFISNDREPDLEKIEKLFRKHGDDLTVNDRWAIQESIFIAENDAFLDKELGKQPFVNFTYKKRGSYFKQHGYDAAKELRELLHPSLRELNLDVYKDFRKIGIHIYRKKLENSNISGISINHDSIGKFVLINYDEDVFRQRFTAAHEAAHAIFDLDNNDDYLSFSSSKWDKKDLVEIRADSFASEYLVPDFALNTITDNKSWTKEKLIDWAIKLKVSAKVLLYALKEKGLINNIHCDAFNNIHLPKEYKIDPELKGLAGNSLIRKEYLLQKGITHEYILKCAKAMKEGIISIGRLAEMLLVDIDELVELDELFKLGIRCEN